MPILWPARLKELPKEWCLEITHLVNRPGRVFIGSDAPHQRLGILQIGLLTEINSKYDDQLSRLTELAGNIADHFPTDLRMSYGGVSVRVTEAPEVATSFKDEKRSRIVTPVSVRWQAWA
ncbi:phage tail terminator-like protein [Pelagibacterium lentulum]